MVILVCGGDSRQLYAGEQLSKRGHTVLYTLFDRDTVKTVPEPREAIKRCDAVLLPLPVCRAGKYINAPLSDNSLPVGSLSALLTEKQPVFGGMIPFTLAEALYDKNIRGYDYYRDETVIEKNAALTAEGILGILINETPAAVNGASYLITGYGRCAKAAAALLRKLGAKLTIAARSKQARVDAAQTGYDVLDIKELASQPLDFDAVINTVPHLILTKAVIENLNKDAVIVEIASAPFGTDFEAAAQAGVRVIKAPSLPGKVAPKTAGKIIADFIESTVRAGEEGSHA
ncbi:MAG: hypothetical protein IJ766_07685 [Clostridia bacterium]|nr:hypothetical protein [Clostridia bacterium]